MKVARWKIRTATIAAYESGVSSHFKVEMLQRFACSMVERADARQGLAFRPPPDAAMARARRRSRTHEGRTERQSRRGHRPGHRPGKVRADAPRATRRAGYSPIKETILRYRKRGVRGCRGCRGAAAPLTPCPSPGRRPAAHAGQRPQAKEEPNQRIFSLKHRALQTIRSVVTLGRAALCRRLAQRERKNHAFPRNDGAYG